MHSVLFLADPNSIHDLKWMSFFANDYKCYLLVRKLHLLKWSKEDFKKFEDDYRITIVDSIDDFSLRHFYRTLLQWTKIKNILNKYRIQVFHLMYAEPNSLWAFFRKRDKRIMWVLTTRGTDILKTIPDHFSRKDLLNRLVSRIYKISLDKYDFITCTSNKQIVNIKAIASRPRTAIIRTGVDIDKILANTEAFLPDELEGKKYILLPRMMRPLYYHEFSIRAIMDLPQHLKDVYYFVFIDKNSSDQQYVERIAEMLKHADFKYIFLNRQPQDALWEMYKKAALVIMNPISDGSPVSAMEAIICNTPIVSSNLDYDAEIFKSTILKISSWNHSELADLIVKIVERKVLIDREKNKEDILKAVNRKSEMQKLDAIYKLLIGELESSVKLAVVKNKRHKEKKYL